ncbi:unnamed protein product, partial [Rotaria sp. Silwood1]
MVLMYSGIGPAEHLIEMGISCKVLTSYQVNDSNLTLDRFVYYHPDALALSVKEWNKTKTGFLAGLPFGPFALKRIDKTIQDPVWEAAKLEKQKTQPLEYDPTGQWPNQPHIEFWTSE